MSYLFYWLQNIIIDVFRIAFYVVIFSCGRGTPSSTLLIIVTIVVDYILSLDMFKICLPVLSMW